MKFATALVFTSLATGASAFVPRTSSNKASSTSLNSKITKEENTNSKEMSTALPFQLRPHALDGSLAGDVGFDPIGFASDKDALWSYREAEIKHARLAMLAAAGWPIAELFDRKIANLFDADVIVDAANRNPNVLNGGLGKVNPLYWIACLGAAAAIDLKQNELRESGSEEYKIPGDLGWDPLGLYPSDSAGKFRMQTAEIKNGRLAMIAITAFAIQEFVRGYSVVDQTPQFFKPFQAIVDTYGATGTQPIDTHL